jgi:mono/diheme cytochrome c family protein
VRDNWHGLDPDGNFHVAQFSAIVSVGREVAISRGEEAGDVLMGAKSYRGRPIRLRLPWLVATALLVAPLAGWQAAYSQTDEVTRNPIAGSRIFESKGCVKCHSVNGMGGDVGPDLGHISRRRSFYELAATMWNHLPSMGAKMKELGIERPTLDPRETADLIAYLFTLDYFDAPGDVVVGEGLFSEKKCVVCHRVGTFGGTEGPSLDKLGRFGSPILMAAAMWNHGPHMAEEMDERGVERPTFTGAELNDLAAYLESVAPPPLEGPLYVLPGSAEEGRVLFTEKDCIDCHSIQGVGGHAGPDLSKFGAQRSLMEFAAAMWNKAPLMREALAGGESDLPELGGGEMADLVAYLYSIQYFAEAGDVEAGREVLSERGCLGCHRLNGRGGQASELDDVAMSSPAAVIAALWNHSALMERSAAEEPTTWRKLTAEEMADLMAFLQAPSH